MTSIGTKLFTWRSGEFVGADDAGNKYYCEKKPRNPARQKRWVIFPDGAGVEASAVPPEWHADIRTSHQRKTTAVGLGKNHTSRTAPARPKPIDRLAMTRAAASGRRQVATMKPGPPATNPQAGEIVCDR
jgi:NADH:ubiquinone oxidoreductase subunit